MRSRRYRLDGLRIAAKVGEVNARPYPAASSHDEMARAWRIMRSPDARDPWANRPANDNG